MEKYFCKSIGYNMLVFVDDSNQAIGFDAATLHEAEYMDISGIADFETVKEIAAYVSRDDDIFYFDSSDWDSITPVKSKRKCYDLVYGTQEFKSKKDIQAFATYSEGATQEIIQSFDNKEDALKELKKYKTSIRTMSAHGTTYYLMQEYYVIENIYDEDGEWVDGGDGWDCSTFPEEWSD